MKVTEGDELKHSQLLFEDYLQRVSAEQREYAEVCELPKMTETDSTDTNQQREGLLEQILSRDRVISLIHKFLRAGVMVGGMFSVK